MASTFRSPAMFAVVLHEGQVVGTELLDYGMAMTADGKPMPVEGLRGQAELTVRGYYDANRNGFFDPDVDQPFVGRNGEPIGETAIIDLPGTTTTTSVSHRSPRTTATPLSTSTDTTSPVSSPGFGMLIGLVALLAGLGLLART